MEQKNVLRAIVLAGLCVGCTSFCVVTSHSEIPEDELEALVEKIRPSIVRVHTFRSNWRLYYGSGFCVNEFGDVITNAHVVEDARSIHIQTRNGVWFPVNAVLAKDDEADLALLATSIPSNMICPLPPVRELPQAGEDVVLVSSEPLTDPEVLKGTVTGVFTIPGMGRFVAVRAAIRGGWSGSAVVNAIGAVVGAVTGYLSYEDAYCRAAPVDAVWRFADRKGLDFFHDTYEQLDLSYCTARELEYGARMSCYNRNYREAIRYCKLAFAEDPEFTDAYILAAWCHGKLGEHKDAVEMLTYAVRLRPCDAGIYENLAWSHEQLGNEEEVIGCYEQAVRLQPGDLMSRFWLGRAYERQKLYSRAIEQYREGVRLRPEGAVMYVALGQVYKYMGKYAEAVSILKNAADADPHYSLAHEELAECYELLGNSAAAVDEYDVAVRLDPTNGFARLALGRCYLALGDLWRGAGSYWALKVTGDGASCFLADMIYEEPPEEDSE